MAIFRKEGTLFFRGFQVDSSFLLELEFGLLAFYRRREPTTNWIYLWYQRRNRTELVGERFRHCSHPCSRQTLTAERVIHIREIVRNIEQSMKGSSNLEVLSGAILHVRALLLSNPYKTTTKNITTNLFSSISIVCCCFCFLERFRRFAICIPPNKVKRKKEKTKTMQLKSIIWSCGNHVPTVTIHQPWSAKVR